MIEKLLNPAWDKNCALLADAQFYSRSIHATTLFNKMGGTAWYSQYKDNPYHNWRHATQVWVVAKYLYCSTLHSANVFKSSKDVETSLDIAALLHDAVHAGTCAGQYDDRANVEATVALVPKLLKGAPTQRMAVGVQQLIRCTAFNPETRSFAPIDMSLPPAYIVAQQALRDADMVAGYWHWHEWPVLIRGLMVELGRDPTDEGSCYAFLREQLLFMGGRTLFTDPAKEARDAYCAMLERIIGKQP